jgi:hypothetical protein
VALAPLPTPKAPSNGAPAPATAPRPKAREERPSKPGQAPERPAAATSAAEATAATPAATTSASSTPSAATTTNPTPASGTSSTTTTASEQPTAVFVRFAVPRPGLTLSIDGGAARPLRPGSNLSIPSGDRSFRVTDPATGTSRSANLRVEPGLQVSIADDLSITARM